MHAAAGEVFRALADPTRRALFERLSRGEAPVKELTARMGVSQPAVSQHLAALHRAGLVSERREGRLRYSWQGGTDDATGYGSRLDTTVTWTLTPTVAGGTQLKLEHAGFTERNAFAFEGIGKGWGGRIAERIVEVLASLA